MIKIVYGTQSHRIVGRISASIMLLWDLWSGRCHLLTTRPHYQVQVKEFFKGGKHFMQFTVELRSEQE